MSFLSLPFTAEDRFKEYLSGNFGLTFSKVVPDSGETEETSYNFTRFFSTDPLEYSAVVVGVESLKEQFAPSTGCFQGLLKVEIATQIDDVTNPVETHDAAVTRIHSLLANEETVKQQTEAGNFKLLQIYEENWANSLGQGGSGERLIVTTLEYFIICVG